MLLLLFRADTRPSVKQDYHLARCPVFQGRLYWNPNFDITLRRNGKNAATASTRLVPDRHISLLYYASNRSPMAPGGLSHKTFCTVKFAFDPPLTAPNGDIDLWVAALSQLGPLSVPEENTKANLKASLLVTAALARLESRDAGQLTFGDANLSKALNDGKFTTHVNSRVDANDTSIDARATSVTLDFGSAGTAIQVGEFAFSSPEEEKRCENRVLSAGRPFTFFLGYTTDRIIGADYHFVTH